MKMTSEDFDPDNTRPIPDPQTDKKRDYNEAILNYKKAKAEQESIQKTIDALQKFQEEMKNPERRKEFMAGLHNLRNNRVSEVEEREFRWLKAQVEKSHDAEKKTKAEEKLINWKRSHPAAAVIMEEQTREKPT